MPGVCMCLMYTSSSCDMPFHGAVYCAVWREFEALVGAGCVRQLGISNIYDLRALQNIYNDADVKPAVVQNRYSTVLCKASVAGRVSVAIVTA